MQEFNIYSLDPWMEWGAMCFTTGMVLGWLSQLPRFHIIDGIILLGDFLTGKMEKCHCPKCWVVGGVIQQKIWFYQLLKFSAFTTKMFGYNDQLDDIEENRAIKDNVPLRSIFYEYPRSEGFHANNEHESNLAKMIKLWCPIKKIVLRWRG